MVIRPYKKGDESQIVWLINNTWRSAYADIFPSEVFDERDRTADARIADFADRTTVSVSYRISAFLYYSIGALPCS